MTEPILRAARGAHKNNPNTTVVSKTKYSSYNSSWLVLLPRVALLCRMAASKKKYNIVDEDDGDDGDDDDSTKVTHCECGWWLMMTELKIAVRTRTKARERYKKACTTTVCGIADEGQKESMWNDSKEQASEGTKEVLLISRSVTHYDSSAQII